MFKRFKECSSIFKDAHREIISLPSNERKKGFKKIALVVGIWFLIGLVGIFLSNLAHADIVSHGVLDSIAKSYKDATGGWSSVLVGSAHTLFFYLASIELAWTGIVWVMEKDNLSSFTTALIKKTIWLGFFYALLLNFDTWVPAIINSFGKAGLNAAHLSQGLSPSLVIEVGLDCLDHIMSAVDKLGFWAGIFPSLMASICSLFILACFFVIALQLLATLVESYIILSAGIIFLGFGGSRLTNDFVQKFLGYAVSVGVKLFMIYLIIGIGMSFSDGWAKLLQGEDKDLIRNFVVIAGSTFIYAGLVWKIPAFAASLMSGVSTFTAGGMAGSAAMPTGGAVAVAGAGMTSIGGAGAAINSAVKMAGGGSGGSGGALGSGSLGGSSGGGGGGEVGGATGGASSGSSNAFNMAAPSAASDASNTASSNQSNSNAASSSPEKRGESSNSSPSTTSANETSARSGSASSSSGNEQSTKRATEGEVFMSSASGSSSRGRTSVSPPSQEDSGGSIEQAPSEKPFSKMFTPEQIQAHTTGADQNARRRTEKAPQDHIPNDEVQGATVHIKLDHPHD